MKTHTYPEPPGHSEDHLRIILRRELPLSDGNRRSAGEDSVSANNVATTVSGVAGCCFTDSPLGQSWRTTTAVNWTELAVRRQEVTCYGVTIGRRPPPLPPSVAHLAIFSLLKVTSDPLSTVLETDHQSAVSVSNERRHTRGDANLASIATKARRATRIIRPLCIVFVLNWTRANRIKRVCYPL